MSKRIIFTKIAINLKTDLSDIQETLKGLFKNFTPPLHIRKDYENVFEVAGTKEALQGKQKVDGFYFGSVVPKPKDIRMYFFPIYTHPDQFKLSDDLQKCLKGKSCFHIKKISSEMESEIGRMIEKGVDLYQKDGLI